MKQKAIPTLRPVGFRGSWFATIRGKQLACVHKHWFKRLRYEDPGLSPRDPGHAYFVGEIERTRRVILTDDIVTAEGAEIRFTRKGYIALWSVSDINFDQSGLHFQFVDRLANLV